MNSRYQTLLRITEVLASDADAQLKYLNGIGVPCMVDELALEYDAIAAAAADMLITQEITQIQYDAIKTLHSLLSSMGGENNASLWEEESLKNSTYWQSVRDYAKLVLVSLRKPE